MRWLAVAVAVGPFALSCGDGVLVCPGVGGGSDWICPGGGTSACALPPARCAPPDQVEACQAGSGFKADYATCTLAGSGGFCTSGVCQPCTPDLDGCSYADWTAMTVPMGFTADLTGIYVAGPRDAFAVGSAGELLHYDGIQWSQLPSEPSMADFVSVTGDGSDGILAVAKTQTIYAADSAGTWSTAGSANLPLQAITSAGGVVTAVGIAGEIVQFDGTTWVDEKGSGANTTGQSWDGVWTVGGTTFVVGNEGAVLINSGSGWVQSIAPMAAQLQLTSVWGSSGSDAYATSVVSLTGVPNVLHFDGSAWSTLSAPSARAPLEAVWGSGSNAVFAVGNQVLVSCELPGCAAWSAVTDTPTNPVPGLDALGGVLGGYVFAVGANGTIWKFGEPTPPQP